jgi:hypothetical protein
MGASSAEAAQLAMLRLLWLQRETHRAVRGRHREAAIMLARSAVEVLLLGLYCLRVPEAIARLHAGNLKALGDGLAYVEEAGLAPADVIRESVARLGKPSDRYLTPWNMVVAIDDVNGNHAARSIYRRLLIPLSNYTVHANGGTLLRHVRRNGKLRHRPSLTWTRRGPARAADAATGLLAADLAKRAGVPHDRLVAYANRHSERTLMPMIVMMFTGMGGSPRPHKLREISKLSREVYVYLWTGPAAADSIETRAAFIRERFARILDVKNDPDIPDDALDPIIDWIANEVAHAVPSENS